MTFVLKVVSAQIDGWCIEWVGAKGGFGGRLGLESDRSKSVSLRDHVAAGDAARAMDTHSFAGHGLYWDHQDDAERALQAANAALDAVSTETAEQTAARLAATLCYDAFVMGWFHAVSRSNRKFTYDSGAESAAYEQGRERGRADRRAAFHEGVRRFGAPGYMAGDAG